jgi:hypothetical protein
MAALGARLSNVIIALAIVFTPRVARIVRSVTLVVRELDYVQAAQALGASDTRILARHVLPNCLAPIIVQATFIFADSVLAEAALSFLGVGLPPYIPSWGTIITAGRMFMQTAPWITVFPGVAILISVLGNLSIWRPALGCGGGWAEFAGTFHTGTNCCVLQERESPGFTVGAHEFHPEGICYLNRPDYFGASPSRLCSEYQSHGHMARNRLHVSRE